MEITSGDASKAVRHAGGEMGWRFVRALSNELRGVQARRWNTERLIVFPMVILKYNPHITAY